MRTKGFTLIEVLVVVVILAFVALGIIALLPNGYKQITTAGRISVLNHLGYQQLDTLIRISAVTHFAGLSKTTIREQM
jgi:prepilin-type N-terminal cleavage/methylation domain-containing protein